MLSWYSETLMIRASRHVPDLGHNGIMQWLLKSVHRVFQTSTDIALNYLIEMTGLFINVSMEPSDFFDDLPQGYSKRRSTLQSVALLRLRVFPINVNDVVLDFEQWYTFTKLLHMTRCFLTSMRRIFTYFSTSSSSCYETIIRKF